MILVHKPQAIHNYGPAYHRRHPSAPLPALVPAVLPTKTPGLLSLSKPVQQTQNRNRSSPKPKQKSPQPGHAVAAATLQPAAEIVDTQSGKVSQSPERRGRQAPTATSKAKPTPRSVSSRRPRQQTPPTVPSQAEESTPPKPFFDSFTNSNSALKLAKPSGKLAHRRQVNLFSDTTTPSKAIPVPTLATNRKPSYKRASAPPDLGFPICDDISELGDPTDVDDKSPPATPTRPRRQHTYTYGFEDGPKTAPLSSSGSMASFQFYQPASLRGSPASGKKAGTSRPRRHVRSPSEGVFHMSDEERDSLPSLSSSSGNSSLSSLNSSPSEELRALFGLGPFGSFGKKERAMFASSTFLNSPDPEELPPPSF